MGSKNREKRGILVKNNELFEIPHFAIASFGMTALQSIGEKVVAATHAASAK